ncbi:hypothetical protein AHAS_Ahas12G0025900 [Arachis hypogaea]
MGQLKQLHILSNYIVGKSEDNGIQELGGLLNLHASLEIEKLENVVDANQARNARIIDKKHIEELLLKWSSGDDMVSNTHSDEQDILQGLQPHRVLKVLEIDGYKGTILPDWMGHSLYQNMTSVSLKSCKNCCMLPSLGQLPSLKSLCIESFDELKRIGKEFYKNEGHQHSSPIAPFPSLERLQFHNMPCWEECSKLEALPRGMNSLLPNLESLDIRGCPNICRWPEGGLPPNLKELSVQVRGLSWLGNLDNLTRLTVSGRYSGRIIKSYPEVDSLPRLPSLATLHIQEFDEQETLECNELLRLTSLQQLHISYCKRLKNMEGENLPPSLLLLKIYDCGLLGEHCKNKHQQIWPRISHIPTIEVDHVQIF